MNINSVHQKVTTFAHKHSDTLFGLTFLMLFVFAPFANELNLVSLFFCFLFYAYANVRVLKLLGYQSKSESSPLIKLVILTLGTFIQFFIVYLFFRLATLLAGYLPVIVAELVYVLVAGIGAYLFLQLQNFYHSYLVRGINLIPALLGGAEQVSRLPSKAKTMVTTSFTSLFFIAFLFSITNYNQLSIITFGILTFGGLLLTIVNYFIFEASQECESEESCTSCPLLTSLNSCKCTCSFASRFNEATCFSKIGIAVQMLLQLFFKGVACAFQEFWAVFDVWKDSVSNFDKRHRNEQELNKEQNTTVNDNSESQVTIETTSTAKEFVKDVVHQAEEAAHEISKTAQQVINHVVDAAEEKVQEYVDEATHSTVAEPQTVEDLNSEDKNPYRDIARIVREARQPRVPFNKE